MDDATRAGITSAAQRAFDLAAKGDTASLRSATAPSLAADFSGIEGAIKDNHAVLADAKGSVSSVYGLELDTASPNAEFYCGVFGKNGQTANSAVFQLDSLQPGKYAVAVVDAVSPKSRYSFAIIFQKVGNDWKLAGLYIRPEAFGGHDSEWFAARAREYKAKGQIHNAWLYFYEAWNLASPLTFMTTRTTETIYNESQSALPADFPVGGKTADLVVGTTTYKLTALIPDAVGDDLDLAVKYQIADASNANAAYQANMAVMKALIAKYPELKDAFTGIVARAVDSSGRDYGTLLAVKDIK